MGRRTTLALGLVAAALGGGCGTVTNLKQPTHRPASNPDAPVCRVYGGVRADAVAMVHLPWSHMPSYIDYGVIPVMCLIDLTFTTFGDTVTLPYTVGAEITRAFFPPKPPAPVVVTKPAPVPVPVEADEGDDTGAAPRPKQTPPLAAVVIPELPAVVPEP